MKKTLLFTVFIILISSNLFAQEDSLKHKLSLTIGVSALKFTGDVGKQTDVNPLLDTKLGYYLNVEQRFGKVLGVALGFSYGTLQGTDHSKNSHLNFKTTAMQGELLLTANFDKVFKYDPKVSPFINVGIGYMMFDPKGDLKNSDGLTYNYWTDGSIRYIPETVYNVNTFSSDPSTIIKRDYNYETTLTDSSNAYSRAALVLPLGGGMNFHIDSRWTASIGVNYYMVFSDFVDNYKKGGSDSYVQAHVGIQYEFKKKKKSIYENVDFTSVDNLDVDKDGVIDNDDRCLGTPKGVPVDKNGCALDTDKDGVEDYHDLEPNTKKGATIDGSGVTIDVEKLAKHQQDWDSLSTDRSRLFNENPTIVYLKNVESQTIANAKNKPVNPNRIPPELRSADTNKDGLIAVSEITTAIDGFFEGTNNFSVTTINKLIDYFFEQ